MTENKEQNFRYDRIIEMSTWIIMIGVIFGASFLGQKYLASSNAYLLIGIIVSFALLYYLIIYKYFSRGTRIYLKNIADIVLISVLIYLLKDYGQYFFALYFLPIAATALSLEFINALLIAAIASLLIVFEFFLNSYDLMPQNQNFYQSAWQIGMILLITIFCRFLALQIKQEKSLKEESQAKEKAMAEEMKKEKEFISLTSHQLYTPLSIIRGFASMLNNQSLGNLNEKQHAAVEKIHHNSKRMVDLISELLAVSRIQSETFKINPTEVNLAKLAGEIVDDFNKISNKPQIKVELNLENNLKPISADSDKIRQVLENLIDNALKYSNKGKVVLEIKQNEKETIFSCSDAGAGIAEENKEKIFQPFFRGKNILELDNKGTGLGLYIAKLIIEAHGGKIWFSSKEKEGSTFYFNIPNK